MNNDAAIVAVPRRIEVLAYIIERLIQAGASPSYGEIALHLRIGRTRVCTLIAQLVRLGLIERSPASRRGIRVRDVALCRQIIEQALGTQGWWHAAPLGNLEAPQCTFEHLPVLPLIRHSLGVD